MPWPVRWLRASPCAPSYAGCQIAKFHPFTHFIFNINDIKAWEWEICGKQCFNECTSMTCGCPFEMSEERLKHHSHFLIIYNHCFMKCNKCSGGYHMVCTQVASWETQDAHLLFLFALKNLIFSFWMRLTIIEHTAVIFFLKIHVSFDSLLLE